MHISANFSTHMHKKNLNCIASGVLQSKLYTSL